MILPHLVGYDTSGRIGTMPWELKQQFTLGNTQKHKFGSRYVSSGDMTAKKWGEYYKFAVVRNPWDRVVSEFCWRNSRTETRPWCLAQMIPPATFGAFIGYCAWRINDPAAHHDWYWPHAQPQHMFVTDDNGEAILDDVFRFENLDVVVDELRERMKLPLELPKHNATPRKDYREFYDANSIKRVRELYAKDIDMFEYEF
jgi:hypothetical protein